VKTDVTRITVATADTREVLSTLKIRCERTGDERTVPGNVTEIVLRLRAKWSVFRAN